MTEQTGQRGEAETGPNSTDTSAETSQDEADEMAGPDEQSGYEGDSGSSSGGSESSSSSDGDSSDGDSSQESSSSGDGSSGDDSSGGDSPQESSSNSSQDSDSGSDSSQESSSSGQQDGDQQAQQSDTESDTDEGSSPRGRSSRAPVNVGDLVWKVANTLAIVVRIVGYVLAAVLVAFLVLTFIGANTANGVAQVIGSVADFAVLSFRDLFLFTDPTFTVVVNYGLAAIFWVLVAEFGSRLVRWLGARLT